MKPRSCVMSLVRRDHPWVVCLPVLSFLRQFFSVSCPALVDAPAVRSRLIDPTQFHVVQTA